MREAGHSKRDAWKARPSERCADITRGGLWLQMAGTQRQQLRFGVPLLHGPRRGARLLPASHQTPAGGPAGPVRARLGALRSMHGGHREQAGRIHPAHAPHHAPADLPLLPNLMQPLGIPIKAAVAMVLTAMAPRTLACRRPSRGADRKLAQQEGSPPSLRPPARGFCLHVQVLDRGAPRSYTVNILKRRWCCARRYGVLKGGSTKPDLSYADDGEICEVSSFPWDRRTTVT